MHNLLSIVVLLSISYYFDFHLDSAEADHCFFLQPATRVLNTIRLVHVFYDLPQAFLLLNLFANQLFGPHPVWPLFIQKTSYHVTTFIVLKLIGWGSTEHSLIKPINLLRTSKHIVWHLNVLVVGITDSIRVCLPSFTFHSHCGKLFLGYRLVRSHTRSY